jgi:hypothetical protein
MSSNQVLIHLLPGYILFPNNFLGIVLCHHTPHPEESNRLPEAAGVEEEEKKQSTLTILMTNRSHWSPPTMVHALPTQHITINNPLRSDNNNDSDHRCTRQQAPILCTSVSSLDRSTKNVSSTKLTLSNFCCIQFRPYHYHTNYARQTHKLFNHHIYLYPLLFCIHIFPISK